MRLLAMFYIFATLAMVGGMLFDGQIWLAFVLLIGSVLGFAGGAGMRGAFYLGQKVSGFIIGLLLLAAGAGMIYYSEIVLSFAGHRLSGDTWAFLGFGIAFLAARPSDVAPRDPASAG